MKIKLAPHHHHSKCCCGMTASVLGALEPIKNYVETCISILYSLLKINIFWRPVDGTNTISISLTKPRFKKSIETQTVTSVCIYLLLFISEANTIN